VPDWTPEEIQIRRRALTVLKGVLMAAQPLEGCALLLGEVRSDAGTAPRIEQVPGGFGGALDAPPPAWPALQIRLIWPCLNVWEPASERSRRFRLDPREQLLAQRWGRARGLQVLGAAHSHPCSDPVPSATDLELAFPPTLQLILSPLKDWAPACWWLELSDAGPPTPRPLRWRMVD
jgi:proteasome lid subunit RPN8/RPN11